MRLFIRLLAFVLLARHATALSTNLMQNNDIMLDGALESLEDQHSSHHKTPEDLQSLKRSLAEVLNLRGSDHFEQQASSANSTISRPVDATTSKVQVVAFVHGMAAKISMTKIMAVCFLVLISLLSLFIICWSDDVDNSSQLDARSREDILSVENCDGTWAQTYRNADEQSKQGLELLFRCKIIPTDEFAHSKVNQEHIHECVWIAQHMLKQRPLENWLEVWPEAQRTFEESVTACFAARTDVRSNFYDSLPLPPSQEGVALDPQAPVNQSQYLLGQRSEDSLVTTGAMPTQSEPVPAAGGSSIADQPSSTGVPTKSKTASATPKRELPPILKTPADRNSLMERCREIMAKSDAQRRPWDSKAKSKSPSPVTPGFTASDGTGGTGQPSPGHTSPRQAAGKGKTDLDKSIDS